MASSGKPGAAAAQTTASASMRRRTPPPALLEELARRFGERFSASTAMCLQHGTDESHYAPVPPDAVVFPLTTEEVALIVRLCGDGATPVIPFGVGSSIEGHVLAVEGGICIDLSRMNQVLSVQTEDLTATVQAGATREDLNRALNHTGFFFSVDPGANASIGGMVATGASGTNSVRYGTMRDNVLCLTVVTAQGKIVRTARRARKSSAGYSLTQLFTGSEGTLGVITEVTVKLHPQPEAMAAAVVDFPDTGAAVATVIQAIQMGIPLARAEMLDALSIRAINAHSHTCLVEAPTLFLEFCGSQTQIDAQSSLVRELADGNGGGDFTWATRPEDRSRLWTPRHHAYFASLQLKPGSRSFTTDACVPISRLAECLAKTVADIDETGLTVPVFGHVGDGNFHCLILVDPDAPDEVAAAEALSHRIIMRALAHDGTSSGEHGVGLHKIGYLEEEHGVDAVELMARIKQALDPDNILNPGKVLRLQRRTASA